MGKSTGCNASLFVFVAEGNEEATSEILCKGATVLQVGEADVLPEPEKICFMHTLHGVLRVVEIQAEQSLGDWHGWVAKDGEGICLDGYFTTKGGKVPDSRGN